MTDIDPEREFDEALGLAIARHARDHGPPGAEWTTPFVERWAAAPAGELEGEAQRRRTALERWREEARSTRRDDWEAHRIGWLQAMQWLGSARTGSFETSSGRLFDFLVAVGAPTREFEIF